MSIIIDHGLVYDSDQNTFHTTSIYIENGLIREISDSLKVHDAEVIDASGYYVLPGLIDLHSHLREPGETHKETIRTGTQAAAKGGYTHIIAMANTKPPLSCQEAYSEILQTIHEQSVISVTQAGTITDQMEGETLSPLLLSSSLKIYSDDGKGVASASLLKKALMIAKESGALLILHEEDAHISQKGVVHDGIASAGSGLPTISSLSESAPIMRDLLIAKEVDYPLHFTHISSQTSVALLQSAHSLHYPYSADVTPHHLFFSDESISLQDSNYKMKPPIRSESDREALIQGLLDGSIQAIATDHAPHTAEEKQRSFLEAPFGIIGLETAFAACYTALVLRKQIPFETIIPWLTSNPASIVGLSNEGSIRIGNLGNLALISLEERVITPNSFQSKSTNSPFIGKKLTGFPIMTVYKGTVIYETSC